MRAKIAKRLMTFTDADVAVGVDHAGEQAGAAWHDLPLQLRGADFGPVQQRLDAAAEPAALAGGPHASEVLGQVAVLGEEWYLGGRVLEIPADQGTDGMIQLGAPVGRVL